MSFNFVERVESLTPEQRLHFYELLAHNLTVSVRAVWSDAGISDTEKVEQIKWINEVAHQVTAKIYVLRLCTHEWTEADTWQVFEWAAKQNPNIKGHLAFALKQSYNSVTSGTQN